MDLTSIEATSVAIRTGQAAAADLARLLSTEEAHRPIEDWFAAVNAAPQEGEARLHQVEALTATLDKLGGYVCHAKEPVAGERLYRWAVHEELVPPLEWADIGFTRQQAFNLFSATVRAVYLPLKAEQDRLEASGKEPPKQIGLALEDSIFEQADSLATLRPEAVAAGKAAGKMAKTAIAEQARAAKAKPAAPPPEPPKPISIGEAPARPPVNRGGRGNRREE